MGRLVTRSGCNAPGAPTGGGPVKSRANGIADRGSLHQRLSVGSSSVSSWRGPWPRNRNLPDGRAFYGCDATTQEATLSLLDHYARKK